MRKVLYLVIVVTQFSCMSLEKRVLKNPAGAVNKRKENRLWKSVIKNYADSMSKEQKMIWSSVEIISQ